MPDPRSGSQPRTSSEPLRFPLRRGTSSTGRTQLFFFPSRRRKRLEVHDADRRLRSALPGMDAEFADDETGPLPCVTVSRSFPPFVSGRPCGPERTVCATRTLLTFCWGALFWAKENLQPPHVETGAEVGRAGFRHRGGTLRSDAAELDSVCGGVAPTSASSGAFLCRSCPEMSYEAHVEQSLIARLCKSFALR